MKDILSVGCGVWEREAIYLRGSPFVLGLSRYSRQLDIYLNRGVRSGIGTMRRTPLLDIIKGYKPNYFIGS